MSSFLCYSFFNVFDCFHSLWSYQFNGTERRKRGNQSTCGRIRQRKRKWIHTKSGQRDDGARQGNQKSHRKAGRRRKPMGKNPLPAGKPAVLPAFRASADAEEKSSCTSQSHKQSAGGKDQEQHGHSVRPFQAQRARARKTGRESRRFAAIAPFFLPRKKKEKLTPKWHPDTWFDTWKYHKITCKSMKYHERKRRGNSSHRLKNQAVTAFSCHFVAGGEGEIRTLEAFYRLHDFQSCALDQLSDFSKTISHIRNKSIHSDSFVILSQFFSQVKILWELFLKSYVFTYARQKNHIDNKNFFGKFWKILDICVFRAILLTVMIIVIKAVMICRGIPSSARRF